MKKEHALMLYLHATRTSEFYGGLTSLGGAALACDIPISMSKDADERGRQTGQISGFLHMIASVIDNAGGSLRKQHPGIRVLDREDAFELYLQTCRHIDSKETGLRWTSFGGAAVACGAPTTLPEDWSEVLRITAFLHLLADAIGGPEEKEVTHECISGEFGETIEAGGQEDGAPNSGQ